ncbi:F-box/LRR-repeat protein 13 [Linum perenne]
MKKQPKKSAAAAGKDLISELPDEILHSIIRRIACSKAAEQTIALSSRWRNLWRSYPVVQLNPKTTHDFYSIGSEVFQKFHDATMKRFNQEKLLQMEALKLFIDIDEDHLSFPAALEQLLELASERKAEYVGIEIGFRSFSLCCLPFRLLSNSSAKTLKLKRIKFASGNNGYLIVLNSLHSLHLNNVEFNDKRLFTNLIASSPLLETLKLESVTGMGKLWVSDVAKLKTLRFLHLNHVEFNELLLADLIASSPLLETLKLEYLRIRRKLVVSNAANLKKLEICYCYSGEIQIAAFGLRYLHIRHSSNRVIGLIAPQLNVLQLCGYHKLSLLRVISSDDLSHLRFLRLDELTIDDVQVFLNLIAANLLLETLQLRNIKNLKKLQLSNVPNLKTIVITHCIDLEEIEISAHKLHSLYLGSDFGRSKIKRMLPKIELIAPQLNDLKIINYSLRMVDLKAIVCNLQYLKYLNLAGIAGPRRWKSWNLEFKGRKLEEFILWVSRWGLKRFELDADVDAGQSVVIFLRSFTNKRIKI